MITHEQARSYLFEVLRESEIADECHKRFTKAALKWLEAKHAPTRTGPIVLRSMRSERDLLVCVEGFLSACARISLMFFPQRSAGTFAKERGQMLRKLLAIGDDHPLSSRDLRNHWAHFDERLDSVVRQGHDVPIGYYIASAGDFDVRRRSQILRLIDPGAEAVHILGTQYSLRRLADAMDHIGQKAALYIADSSERENGSING